MTENKKSRQADSEDDDAVKFFKGLDKEVDELTIDDVTESPSRSTALSVIEPGRPLLVPREDQLASTDVDDRFDYGRVLEKYRNEVMAATQWFASRRRQTILEAFEQGKKLVEIKRLMQFGTFLDWVEQSLGMEERTVQRLMKIAERLAGKVDNLTVLPLSVHYELTANSIKDEAINECVELGRKGELTRERAAAIIDLHKKRNNKPRASSERPPIVPQSTQSIDSGQTEHESGSGLVESGRTKDPVNSIIAAVENVRRQNDFQLTGDELEELLESIRSLFAD
ncbi:MAG: DUF3102 domain-containing protein [Alsobacter sp.]